MDFDTINNNNLCFLIEQTPAIAGKFDIYLQSRPIPLFRRNICTVAILAFSLKHRWKVSADFKQWKGCHLNLFQAAMWNIFFSGWTLSVIINSWRMVKVGLLLNFHKLSSSQRGPWSDSFPKFSTLGETNSVLPTFQLYPQTIKSVFSSSKSDHQHIMITILITRLLTSAWPWPW